jgi:hypothetical protein
MIRAIIMTVAAEAMFPAAASAARWILVANSSGVERYIDVDAVVIDGRVVTFWQKTEYANQGKSGETSAVEKWMHDCANSRAKLLALTLYKADGSVIGSAQLPRYRQEWTDIIANSAGEAVHQRVCGAMDDVRQERDAELIHPATV